MNARPLSVVVVGWLFVAMGTVGFVYHAMGFRAQGPIEQGFFWVLVLRLLAIVGGVFVLRGANWARWLLAAWLAYHVVLSAWHSLSEVIVHAALLAIVAYVFFRARASGFFRKAA